MFEKIKNFAGDKVKKGKDFVNEHKGVIIGGCVGVGGIIIVAIGKALAPKTRTIDLSSLDLGKWELNAGACEIVDKYNGTLRVGSNMPFVEKEDATRFMEDKGNTYQAEIIDANTSCIWISK